MRLGIVADDNTGASDAAGMLAERGVRTLLVFDAAVLGLNPGILAQYDSLVVGTRSRSIPPQDAYRVTFDAMRLLDRAGCDRFQLKYCSTFDSTRQGNIGPSLDAALDALGESRTVVCPALPVNGRRVYRGHLFVGDAILSDSPLREHPLNPMTDANIVRWLSHQTARKVGLIPLELVRAGLGAVAETLGDPRAETRYWVVDACEEEDLLAIAGLCRDMRLVSGGSGITSGLGAVHWPGRARPRFDERLPAPDAATLVVSGSMSPATAAQTAWAAASGYSVTELDVRAVLRGETELAGTADAVVASLQSRGRALVIPAARGRGEVASTQAFGAQAGLDPVEVGKRITQGLGEVARLVCARFDLRRLIVSGGETSGSVAAALGLTAMETGLPIEPGVPFLFPLDRPGLVVALKSGNFGSEDFYGRACRAMAKGRCCAD